MFSRSYTVCRTSITLYDISLLIVFHSAAAYNSRDRTVQGYEPDGFLSDFTATCLHAACQSQTVEQEEIAVGVLRGPYFQVVSFKRQSPVASTRLIYGTAGPQLGLFRTTGHLFPPAIESSGTRSTIQLCRTGTPDQITSVTI